MRARENKNPTADVCSLLCIYIMRCSYSKIKLICECSYFEYLHDAHAWSVVIPIWQRLGGRRWYGSSYGIEVGLYISLLSWGLPKLRLPCIEQSEHTTYRALILKLLMRGPRGGKSPYPETINEKAHERQEPLS